MTPVEPPRPMAIRWPARIIKDNKPRFLVGHLIGEEGAVCVVKTPGGATWRAGWCWCSEDLTDEENQALKFWEEDARREALDKKYMDPTAREW